MLKKLLVTSVTLVLVMVLWTGTVLAGGIGFDDVKGKWYEQQVVKMQAKGLVSGFSDGYHPDDPVTREQAIVMLVRALGLNTSGATMPATFRNPEKVSSWARPAVAVAAREGIIAGGDLIDFRPRDAAKRFEVAVFIIRAMGLTDEARSMGNVTLNFPDADELPAWAKPYIALANEKGIMGGRSDGTLAPNDEVSRAEMAVLLSRVDRQMGKVKSAEKKGEVYSFSAAFQTITIKGAGGIAETVPVAPGAYFYREGKKIAYTGLAYQEKVLLILNAAGQVVYGEVIPDDEFVYDQVQVSGTIDSVEYNTPLVTVSVTGGAKQTFTVAAGATIQVDGKSAGVQDLTTGQLVTLVAEGVNAVSITAVSTGVQIEGTIAEVAANGKAITVERADNSLVVIDITDETKIYMDFKETTVDSLMEGQEVVVEATGKQAEKVFAKSIRWELEGKVLGVSFVPEASISIEDEDGEEHTFRVDEDARVKVDGRTKTLRDVLAGYEVELELTNNTVTRIYADKVVQSVEGTVKAILLSSTPSITIINSEGQEISYNIASNARIKLNNERVTLGQIQPGDYAELEVEGNLVTAMEVEPRASQSYIIGEVENINTSAQVLVLKVGQGVNARLEQIFLDEDDTLIIKLGESIPLRHLDLGERIIAVGQMDSGLFIASTVLVIGSPLY